MAWPSTTDAHQEFSWTIAKGSGRDRAGGAAASRGFRAGIGLRAERAEAIYIGQRPERQGAGVVLAVEKSRLSRIGNKGAGNGILRVIEPKTKVKHICRRQIHVWIEAKGFVKQNGLQPDVAVIAALGRDDVGLIPGKAKAVKFGILVAIRSEESAFRAENA